MSDEEKGMLVLVILFFFSGILLGAIISSGLMKDRCESEAIDAGAAQYNPKTKQFEWIKK